MRRLNFNGQRINLGLIAGFSTRGPGTRERGIDRYTYFLFIGAPGLKGVNRAKVSIGVAVYAIMVGIAMENRQRGVELSSSTGIEL